MAMFSAIEARGAVPLARVLYNEPWMVNRVLDLGAAGVIVPLVSTAEEAKRGGERLPLPASRRALLRPLRAALTVGSENPERLAAGRAVLRHGRDPRKAWTTSSEIAATHGLDGIYIGLSDLSIGLRRDPGHGGDVLERAIATILEACAASGIVAGMHCNGGGEGGPGARAGRASGRVLTVGEGRCRCSARGSTRNWPQRGAPSRRRGATAARARRAPRSGRAWPAGLQPSGSTRRR